MSIDSPESFDGDLALALASEIEHDDARRLEAMVRQYWRFAAMVYPNGVPPGFELCRAYVTEWQPDPASPVEPKRWP